MVAACAVVLKCVAANVCCSVSHGQGSRYRPPNRARPSCCSATTRAPPPSTPSQVLRSIRGYNYTHRSQLAVDVIDYYYVLKECEYFHQVSQTLSSLINADSKHNHRACPRQCSGSASTGSLASVHAVFEQLFFLPNPLATNSLDSKLPIAFNPYSHSSLTGGSGAVLGAPPSSWIVISSSGLLDSPKLKFPKTLVLGRIVPAVRSS